MGATNDLEERAMQSSQTSAPGIAFAVMSLLLRLLAASSWAALRRRVLWAAVVLLAAILVTVGLLTSVGRAR